MRNILITVMLLMVVILLFVNVVINQGGVRDQIQSKGTETISKFSQLSP